MPKIFRKFSLATAFCLAVVATPLKAELLYVAQNGISAFRISENGSLIPVPGAVPPAGGENSIAVDRFGRFLYAVGTRGIESFRIARSGALSFVSAAPAGLGAGSIAVDPRGRFIFVSNFGDFSNPVDPANGSVSAYDLGRNGALSPVTGSPFPAGIWPVATLVDPFGRFVYAANSGASLRATETISGYRIGQKGVLNPLPGSPFANGSSPQDAAIDPFGRFLYTANFYDNAFSVYRIAENGALAPATGSPFKVAGNSNVVVADPLGRFVYIGHSLPPANYLSGFRVAGNGNLTEVPGSPFRISTGVLAIDLTGRFLYTSGGGGGISAYRISGNGSLSVLPGSPFAVGLSPSSMAVCPEQNLFMCR